MFVVVNVCLTLVGFLVCELHRVSYQYQRNTMVPTRSMLIAMTSASLQPRERSKQTSIFALEDRNK